MILILAFLAGAALGAFRAKSRGGSVGDMAQYGIAHGFAGLVAAAAVALFAALTGLSDALI
ncbi:hypothetical protein [Rubrimonas cliftonensis]|uniref:Uncharacterized protein n=1 Tax=Rubrimonas cliftonensis TaxID=89524 RepID=A0A1H3YU55_9RHOB|nr:hypothetical protein [Rubrimonas cliftonensis]SEA15066.1 hypothetical protein SAMN05444370_103252 [Rubrimonas cliftonensis]